MLLADGHKAPRLPHRDRRLLNANRFSEFFLGRKFGNDALGLGHKGTIIMIRDCVNHETSFADNHGGEFYAAMGIGDRIAQARKAANLSQAALAKKLNVGQSTVAQWETEKNEISFDKLDLLAKHTGKDKGWFLSGDPKPKGDGSIVDNNQRTIAPETISSLGFKNEVRPASDSAPVMSEQENLPVYGYVAGVGEDEMFFIDQGHEMTRTVRPNILRNVSDAYAVDVFGESMSPRFEPGNRLWVHPRRPTKPGDDVVIQLDDERAIVKRLVRKTEKCVVVKQFNPAKEIQIPKKDIKAIHLIVGLLTVGT